MCVCVCVRVCLVVRSQGGCESSEGRLGLVISQSFPRKLLCGGATSDVWSSNGDNGSFHPRHPKGTRLGKTELHRYLLWKEGGSEAILWKWERRRRRRRMNGDRRLHRWNWLASSYRSLPFCKCPFWVGCKPLPGKRMARMYLGCMETAVNKPGLRTKWWLWD